MFSYSRVIQSKLPDTDLQLPGFLEEDASGSQASEMC